MIWFSLALLLICSGIVSASETALFGLSRQALHQFRISGKRKLRRVSHLMQRPRRVLVTILIANTTVNVSIFAIAFIALEPLRTAHALLGGAAGIGVLLAVVVLGETVPKALTLTRTRRLAPAAAGLIVFLRPILTPIQWLLGTFVVNPIGRLLEPAGSRPDPVTTSELRLLVEQSAREGLISSKENEMLQAVVALSDASVREVMTPRVDMASLPIESDPAAARKMLRASDRRHLPVHGRDPDDIRGFLFARDLNLNPTKPLQMLMKPAHFVPEQCNLLQILRHFRESKIEFAIVVDEYGGTTGSVSMNDVARQIVGAASAGQPSGAVRTQEVDENTYRLSGDLSVRVWANRFGIPELDRHIDTVAGLILAKLGRLPRVGESVRVRNLTLTVESMRSRRIEKVILHRDEIGVPRQDGGSAPSKSCSLGEEAQ